MHKYVVVCFFTRDTPYAQESEGLEQSCREHEIHCHREGYGNRGTWVRNAAIKPEFLLEMFEKHPFQDLVYLDADARLRQYPTLFDEVTADIGIHFRKRGGGRKELLSGTIYLKNNERVRAFIRAWAVEQQKRPEDWDQRVLADVLKRDGKDLNVWDIPPTYCQIFDSMRNAGAPVIEHMQASRRFRKLVELGGPHESTMVVPPVLGKVRVRRAVDGTYFIPRRDAIAERFLDKHCFRIPNELRWEPGFITDNRISEFRETFNGKMCYIVGKGPSLDYLSQEDFKDANAPVICLNESIHQVESLALSNPTFCLQQDAKLRDKCKPKVSPLFVSTKAANYYNDYEKAYIFDNLRLSLNRNALSVSAAIIISGLLGSRSYGMVCFDACVNRATAYAQCIGYESTWGGRPERFHGHRAKIERRLGKAPVEWIMPSET